MTEADPTAPHGPTEGEYFMAALRTSHPGLLWAPVPPVMDFVASAACTLLRGSATLRVHKLPKLRSDDRDGYITELYIGEEQRGYGGDCTIADAIDNALMNGHARLADDINLASRIQATAQRQWEMLCGIDAVFAHIRDAKRLQEEQLRDFFREPVKPAPDRAYVAPPSMAKDGVDHGLSDAEVNALKVLWQPPPADGRLHPDLSLIMAAGKANWGQTIDGDPLVAMQYRNALQAFVVFHERGSAQRQANFAVHGRTREEAFDLACLHVAKELRRLWNHDGLVPE